MPMIRYLLIQSVISLASPVFAATAAIDAVTFGNASSERDHRLTVVRTAKSTSLTTTLGSLNRSHGVRMLAASGSGLTWTMSVGVGNTPILLEVQEIHDRRPQVFGYTVTVNGTDVYFRTYQEVGAGPNHYFIDVPRRLAADGKLLITLRNQGEAPVAIGQVWAYGDFERLAAADGTWKPMPVLGQARVLMGVIGTKGKHVAIEGQIPEIAPEQDAQAWKDLSAVFATQKTVAPGFMIFSYYLNQNEPELQREIEESVRWAGNNRVMWQYNFMGGDWGGHPSLLDGRGGDFYDIRYSQAVFDPVTKRYAPTWPGTPGGVIWPTAGEPALNQHIIERSRRTGRMLAERIGLLAAQGIKPADICLVGDEGPSFWWQGGFGDFTPTLVAEAARAGVAIDPANLSATARKWMFDQLTNRYTERCRAISEGLGRDIIPVDRGAVTLPTMQLVDTVFAHTFMNQTFPLFDPRWEGWQNGANDAVWIGGEPLEYVNPSFSDYIASQGRLTNVNLYRPIADFAYLEKLYQWGFQHVALFDAYSGDAEAITKAMAGVDARLSLPARHYLRTVVHLDPALMPGLAATGAVARFDNLQFSPRLDTTFNLVDTANPGRLVLQLGDAGQPLPAGLSLRLDFGDAAHHIGLIEQVTVLAGEDPEHLQAVVTIPAKNLEKAAYWPYFRTATIPLGEVMQGRRQAFVAIDLRTAKGSAETGLRRMSVTRSWDLSSGQLVGDRPTNRQMRMRRLWLQDRALAQRLLDRYRNAAGRLSVVAAADRKLSAGTCKEAGRYLAGEMSLLLPARFAVRGHGKLGSYPVSVSWSDPDRSALVCLVKTERVGAELIVESAEALSGEIRCGGLVPDGRYTMIIDRTNRMAISADPAGTLVADATGTISATCAFTAQAVPGGDGFLAKDTGRVPARTLVAMCQDRDLYEVQDPALASFNPIRIVSAAQAVLTRGREGDPLPPAKAPPRPGDRVEIVLDDAGRAVSVTATYGEVAGRIRSFTPPAVHPAPCNGIIELDDGRSFEFMYRYAAFTKFTVPGLKPWARSNAIDDYADAIKPGMAVKLTYCPYTWQASRPRLLTVTALLSDNP